MELDISLAQDESLLQEYEFSYSVLFFFLKSYFWLTNKRLIVNYPNIFFLFVTGRDTVTFPLRTIGGVRTYTDKNFFFLLFGGMLFFSGIGTLKEGFGFILFLMGVVLLMASFQAIISVGSAGTTGTLYSHVPWETAKAKKMINQLNQLIADI